MDVLRRLKLIRLRENIFRIIPIIILLVSFYFTAELLKDKNELELKFEETSAKIAAKEEEQPIIIEEIEAIDVNQLEVLIFIANEFKYERVDVKKDFAIFEFREDAFFEARDFEEALGKNDYEYILQLAEGEGSWSGIKIEVKL